VAVVFETVAVAVHLEDVDVVGEPIQQGAGEPFGGEDLGPLVEGQIAGNQGGGAFVALAENLEQQFGPVFDGGTKPSWSTMRRS
jgi:hypothetical protein